MSARQEARAERRYTFWSPRFFEATGRERADVAFGYVVARINDLPKGKRAAAFEAFADELMAYAERVTAGDVHISHSHQAGGVPETLRAQARRAGARGTA
jgi:hypothetical protein